MGRKVKQKVERRAQTVERKGSKMHSYSPNMECKRYANRSIMVKGDDIDESSHKRKIKFYNSNDGWCDLY